MARERTRKAGSARPNVNTRVKLFSREEDQGSHGDLIRQMKAYESQQIDDPFADQYGGGIQSTTQAILKPSFNPYSLMRLPNENNTLRQCVDAMVTNVESFGHRLEYVGPEGEEDNDEVKAEKLRIESFLENPNDEYSIMELRERRRRDLETFGYCFVEVGRDIKNEIIMAHHVPAHTMRLTKKDKEDTEVDIFLTREGESIKQKVKKRFRRYVQEVGTRRVYFKEFGDPRPIDPETGLVEPDLAIEDQATEILMDNLYAPGHPYGMPRWINQLPAVLGSRESELTNLQFFKDNAIPAMAILVSGGQLTENSVEEIEEHIQSTKGKKSVHRVMVLEATGEEEAASVDGSIPAPKLDIKPLAGERQSDALFQEYDKHNQKKVRSSFRVPPIFIGLSEDMTYATAEASLVMAEGQVFGPERNKVDDLFNKHLLTREGRTPKYWQFRSNPPRIANPSTVLRAISQFEQVGALTPNVSIGIANELFDLNIKHIQDDWGNYPFKIVMQLVQSGELKGLEDIKLEKEDIPDEVVEPVEELDDELAEEVEEKVLQPLRELVGSINTKVKADVQKSQPRKKRTIRNR